MITINPATHAVKIFHAHLGREKVQKVTDQDIVDLISDLFGLCQATPKAIYERSLALYRSTHIDKTSRWNH